jgi:hypothetical protein
MSNRFEAQVFSILTPYMLIITVTVAKEKTKIKSTKVL